MANCSSTTNPLPHTCTIDAPNTHRELAEHVLCAGPQSDPGHKLADAGLNARPSHNARGQQGHRGRAQAVRVRRSRLHLTMHIWRGQGSSTNQ